MRSALRYRWDRLARSSNVRTSALNYEAVQLFIRTPFFRLTGSVLRGNQEALGAERWKILNVCECQIKDTEALSKTLAESLRDDKDCRPRLDIEYRYQSSTHLPITSSDDRFALSVTRESL